MVSAVCWGVEMSLLIGGSQKRLRPNKHKVCRIDVTRIAFILQTLSFKTVGSVRFFLKNYNSARMN